MAKTSDPIEEVGKIVQKLEDLGLQPVLIGGMALVILGSRRVTRDFDFLVSDKKEQIRLLTEIFYKRNLELTSRTDKDGNILQTIDNAKIAAIRIQLDAPKSVHFFNRKTGLKIDLLFDFPLAAKDLAARASIKKIGSYVFRIASRADLMKLKKIAYEDRHFAADAQDLEFLKKL